MRLVIKCVADDGSEWDTIEEAQARDREILEVRAIMEPIGPEYLNSKDCTYENGHGYIRRDPAVVAEARRKLLEMSREAARWWFDKQEQDHGHRWPESFTAIHPSWFHRILGESGHAPIGDAWLRLWKIDAQGREWGQPYHADNSDQREEFDITLPGSPSPAVP
jgi:hypothetical protein